MVDCTCKYITAAEFLTYVQQEPDKKSTSLYLAHISNQLKLIAYIRGAWCLSG